MHPFTYHRPDSVRRASTLLGKAEDPKLLAGGQTLLPTMKNRLASPANLIDLAKVEGLSGIALAGRSLSIGAMTTHAEVASSDLVKEACPALAALAEGIGDPHVRHKGTIGGSIANNDPAADYPAACLALGATIVTTKRKIEAADYFTGLFSTALEEDEIITKVVFPAVKKAAYMKFPNPASRYALVGVFVAKRGRDIRVAVTGAGANGVFRATGFEDALGKRFSSKSLEGVTLPADDMMGDLHASSEYRAHLVNVMARRAVDKAAARDEEG
jgi:carbon-monoxide dehydrogenase medium subunit